MHYTGFNKSFSKIKITKWGISVNQMPFRGKWGATTFAYYSCSRAVHCSTSERIVKVICDISEAPSREYCT